MDEETPSTPLSFAVELARRAVEEYVRRGKKIKPQEVPGDFRVNCGAFVTIESYPDGKLRGCIGFPEPVYPLYAAIIEAAIAACEDPRFEHIDEEELASITIEVSILTPPKGLPEGKQQDYPRMIKVGRDGLIVEKGRSSGLLLPQVAVEHRMDSLAFLEACSAKAGLPETGWSRPGTKVSTFQAEIWNEERPSGKIVQKKTRK